MGLFERRLNMEIWKEIIKDLYWVSNKGQVKRRFKNGFHFTFGHKDEKGYLRIVLIKDGIKIRNTSVHNLVAEAFIRPLKENEVCHHKNHIRTDNRVQNLQIMTKEQHDVDSINSMLRIRYGKRRMKRKK